MLGDSRKPVKKWEAVSVLAHCWDDLTTFFVEFAWSRHSGFPLEPADDERELKEEEDGE
jgi:hypothetical protein